MKKILLLSLCACLPLFAHAKAKKDVPVDTIQKIKTTGEIVVAVREDQFPFSYLDDAGNARGYTVEVCEDLIKDVRKELAVPRMKVIYFPVKESETELLFRKKAIDLDCGNASITDSKKNMKFSNGVLAVEARILATRTSTAKSLSDFNNQVVAVLKGSSLETLLSNYIKSGTYFYRLKSVNSIDEGVQSMLNGNAKAFINDDLVLLSLLASKKELNEALKITGFPISSREYGFALPDGDEKFKELINNSLKKSLDKNKIHEIYEKWFLLPIPPKNINLDFGMSKSTRELLNKIK